MNYLIVSLYSIITIASFSELILCLTNRCVVKRSALFILMTVKKFLATIRTSFRGEHSPP